MDLRLIIYPDKRLLQRSEEVKIFDATTSNLCDALRSGIIQTNAAGLAAPQVGVHLRICAVKVSEEQIVEMINPVVIWKSKEVQVAEEGCLSIPGFRAGVARSKEVLVQTADATGKVHQLSLSGLPARIAQHEIDHLDGILFTSLVDPAEAIRTRMAKHLKMLKRAALNPPPALPRVAPAKPVDVSPTDPNQR